MPELAAHLERVARELAEQIEVRGENRCAICFWPLAKSVDEGCVRGNCSFRGGDEHEQKARWVIRERIKANAKLLAAALAACARERDRGNREYYKEVLNKAGYESAAWMIHETPLLRVAEEDRAASAERAAGESK